MWLVQLMHCIILDTIPIIIFLALRPLLVGGVSKINNIFVIILNYLFTFHCIDSFCISSSEVNELTGPLAGVKARSSCWMGSPFSTSHEQSKKKIQLNLGVSLMEQ